MDDEDYQSLLRGPYVSGREMERPARAAMAHTAPDFLPKAFFDMPIDIGLRLEATTTQANLPCLLHPPHILKME